jgi:hypothetical protein
LIQTTAASLDSHPKLNPGACMDHQPLVESKSFAITKTDSPPRLYFLMKTFDREAVEDLRRAIFNLSEEIVGHTLIFDYFEFDLTDTDVSLHQARQALVELGVTNVYRVGPFERLCKLVNSLDYENKYNAYFTLSYSELDNLLRMLNR